MAARGLGSSYQGSKWITRERRLAIYIRDGLACSYCGASLEDGASLTLDHVKPFTEGGSHHNRNLITACNKCNSSRGSRSLPDFCESVASYLNHGQTGRTILERILESLLRDVDIEGAKAIIARRGSWQNVLKEGI